MCVSMLVLVGAARCVVRYLLVAGCDFYANGFLHIHVIIIQMSVNEALLELDENRSREPIALVRDALNLTHVNLDLKGI